MDLKSLVMYAGVNNIPTLVDLDRVAKQVSQFYLCVWAKYSSFARISEFPSFARISEFPCKATVTVKSNILMTKKTICISLVIAFGNKDQSMLIFLKIIVLLNPTYAAS